METDIDYVRRRFHGRAFSAHVIDAQCDVMLGQEIVDLAVKPCRVSEFKCIPVIARKLAKEGFKPIHVLVPAGWTLKKDWTGPVAQRLNPIEELPQWLLGIAQ